jgi:hypothetical protein
MNMRHILWSLSLLATLSLGSCARPFVVVTPPGSMELPDQSEAGYDYRATDPDGVVRAVRVIGNADAANLGFFSQAVDNKLRLERGYGLVDKKVVKTDQGLEGVELRYGHDEGRVPHVYRVALFIDGDDLFLIEQGGRADLMKREEASCTAFVRGITIRSGLGRFFSYGGGD